MGLPPIKRPAASCAVPVDLGATDRRCSPSVKAELKNACLTDGLRSARLPRRWAVGDPQGHIHPLWSVNSASRQQRIFVAKPSRSTPKLGDTTR